jgi:hypothetical protein
MRSTRELIEVKEKNNYISKLLRTSNESVKKFEEMVAEFESRLHKREEEFRRADNDRMRRFFNARFDDIPGAISNNQNPVDNLFNGTPSGAFPSRGGNSGKGGAIMENPSLPEQRRMPPRLDPSFNDTGNQGGSSLKNMNPL